jgi:hypothetical protein
MDGPHILGSYLVSWAISAIMLLQSFLLVVSLIVARKSSTLASVSTVLLAFAIGLIFEVII